MKNIINTLNYNFSKNASFKATDTLPFKNKTTDNYLVIMGKSTKNITQ